MLEKTVNQSLHALLAKNQVFTDAASLFTYEVDAGLDRAMPDGVVLPGSARDVAEIVRWAAANGVSLTGRGAGTGLSGGAVAEHGGLIMSFSRMNRVLEIDRDGCSALVEPGLINLRLDEQVREQGLYFPPDPASQRASTIGGNVSENSGGPHCFKYGVTTNYVMGMEVVLADGRIAQVGGRAFDYPAYDFCGLLTGSEGMLALMTSISVRLVRDPPAVQTLLAVFDSVEQASVGVSAVISAGLVPATMEMMDSNIIRIVEAYVHAGLPVNAGAMLIIDVDGYPESLDAQCDEIASILTTHNGYDLRVAKNADERAQIWLGRKSAAGALARLSPAQYTVDVTVPRSRLAEALANVNAICEREQLQVGYVFHAGDGNLHPLILVQDVQDQALMKRVHRAGSEIVKLAVSYDGSLSGEHGVGIEKRAFMPLMFNEAELSAMLDIKHIFDPYNLLNPGNMFPSTDDEPASSVGASLYGRPPHGTEHSPLEEIDARMAGDHKGSPLQVIAPSNVEEAALALAECSKVGQKVHITGGISAKAGQHSQDDDELLLSTSRLRGVMNYAPDDLFITVGAGTPLAEIRAFLAERGQQLPLASPRPDTTIGGLVATNANAPLRMRYGSIRDNVLCATVALADGRMIRAGRPVVKNVAGFDLVKLFVGSFGTLGLLADITLKIAPRPRTCRTLLVPVDDLRYGLIWARQLLPQSLIASAILLLKNMGHVNRFTPHVDSPYLLVYTGEGLEQDAQAELRQVRDALHAAGAPEPVEVENITGTSVWAETLGQAAGSIQVRAGVPIRDLPVYAQDYVPSLACDALVIDLGSGFVHAALPAQDAPQVTRDIERLRASALQANGYAIITHTPEGWQGDLDRWGYTPDTHDVMLRLKKRWDPAGILPMTFSHPSA
jgi:glycolate oxidase subunit GlcD